MENLLVRATERPSYGYIDPRAMCGSQHPDWWHVIWMAVSCCCGVLGPAERADHRLPTPDPRPLGW